MEVLMNNNATPGRWITALIKQRINRITKDMRDKKLTYSIEKIIHYFKNYFKLKDFA